MNAWSCLDAVGPHFTRCTRFAREGGLAELGPRLPGPAARDARQAHLPALPTQRASRLLYRLGAPMTLPRFPSSSSTPVPRRPRVAPKELASRLDWLTPWQASAALRTPSERGADAEALPTHPHFCGAATVLMFHFVQCPESGVQRRPGLPRCRCEPSLHFQPAKTLQSIQAHPCEGTRPKTPIGLV